MASPAVSGAVSRWVIVAVTLFSFLVGASLPLAVAVTGENAARAAIATPLRISARHDRTEVVVD